MQGILAAAGLSFRHVTKTTCIVSDIKNFPAMNGVYVQYFTETPPARATFAAGALPLGALVEIDAIAVKE